MADQKISIVIAARNMVASGFRGVEARLKICGRRSARRWSGE